MAWVGFDTIFISALLAAFGLLFAVATAKRNRGLQVFLAANAVWLSVLLAVLIVLVHE